MTAGNKATAEGPGEEAHRNPLPHPKSKTHERGGTEHASRWLAVSWQASGVVVTVGWHMSSCCPVSSSGSGVT